MRKIRIGMFETNSSSAHVIAIKKGPADDYLWTVDGAIRLSGMEFLWGIESYSDAYTKASYCLTYAKQAGDESLVEMLRKVIERHEGKSVLFSPKGDRTDPWGYIDHQSGPGEHDVCAEAFESEESLTQFIFCRKSVLVIDNDNH